VVPVRRQETDDRNPGLTPFSGEYFRATEDATPFESWLAESLDVLAKEEMRYGWQHPASFTNWLTTDPMSHPNKPFEKEDLVPVDPMHVEPTDAWKAGYFAQYHVYPYYPDFPLYQEDYQTYQDADGDVDPYTGYLNELRAHHEGIPLLVGAGCPARADWPTTGRWDATRATTPKRSKARCTQRCWMRCAVRA
jgi:hypothetical protein